MVTGGTCLCKGNTLLCSCSTMHYISDPIHFIHYTQGSIAPRRVTICVRLITAIGVWADLSPVSPHKPTFVKSIALHYCIFRRMFQTTASCLHWTPSLILNLGSNIVSNCTVLPSGLTKASFLQCCSAPSHSVAVHTGPISHSKCGIKYCADATKVNV